MDDELNKRGSWEQAWQKALEEPSITPSSRVWQGLEHSLMEQQLGRYKKRLALYQGLAAASVVLLGLWAGWWALVAEPTLQPAAQPLATTEISAPVPDVASASGSDTPAPSADRTATSREIAASGSTAPYFSAPGLSFGYATRSLPPAGSWSGSRFHSPFGSSLPSSAGVGLRAYYGGVLYSAESEAAERDEQPGEGLLPLSAAYLRAIEAELALQEASLQVEVQPVALARHTAAASVRDKKKNLWQSNGNVWLGASLASTFFSPNINAANSGLQSFMNQQPVTKDGQVYTANMASWNARENSLPSVDFRLEAAFRIRPRWMVQTSLEYNTYRVGTLAGTFYNHADEQNYPLYYSNFSFDKLQLANPNSRTAQPIQALTTYSFVRVPLGLNYVLLDRTFGLALSSGLATDVFLGSTLADRENRLQEYTIAAGNTSPFNRLHVSGQLGLQLYYRAGHNYLLTLEPSYRHALSDFSKQSSHFHSRPSNFGVAAGFRFILR